MHRFLIITFFIVLFYIILRSLARSWFRKNFGQFTGQAKKKPSVIDKGTMVKCDNCGLYLAEENTLKSGKKNAERKFCSEKCKEEYKG